MSSLTAQVSARLGRSSGPSGAPPQTLSGGASESIDSKRSKEPVVAFVPYEAAKVKGVDPTILKTPFDAFLMRPREPADYGWKASIPAPSNGFACIVHEIVGEAEAYAATVLKAATGAPLVVWFTQPPLISVESSPKWLRNLGAEADAIFAVSQPLRHYAERVLRRPVWISPAVFDLALPTGAEASPPTASHGVMLAAADLCESRIDGFLGALSKFDRKLYWYTTTNALRKTTIEAKGLAKAGVQLRLHATPLERENTTRAAAFALWPSTLRRDDASASRWLTPTAFFQTVANGGPPPIVLSDDGGALATFVQAHGLGEVSSYDPVDLAQAVERISEPSVRAGYKQAMIELGEILRRPGADAYSLMCQAIASDNWLDHPVQTVVFPRR